MNDRELIEKLEAAAERYARHGGPDRPYYDEWRMRLLRIDPDLYEADADAQNRRAGRYLSPQKRKRLDALAAKLDAGNLSEQEAKAIVKRAWGILTPFALMRNSKPKSRRPGPGRSGPPKPTLQIPVTERALIQRINRALPKGQKVKIARGKTAQTRGKFYLVKDGAVVVDNVDLERCARELQVLRYAAAVARRRPQ
jgi:hypothetical protein